LALLVAFFFAAMDTSSWASRSGKPLRVDIYAPRREPPATVHRNPTAALIEVQTCKSQETTIVLGKFF
jgi:hypothetical protein